MTAGDNDTGLNPIDLEALRWALLMESGPLSPEDQRQLDAWVAESSRHQGALVRAQAASLYLDRLGAFASGRRALEAPPSSRRVGRRWVMVAAAASVIGAVGLGAWLGRDHIHIYESWGGGPSISYVSNRGELKDVKLADGSVMTLNTQTEVRVRYTKEHRDIHLMRGEALFTVVHDSGRPFTVRIGEWTAAALGTAFEIRSDTETTNITVTEGVVELRRAQTGSAGGSPRLTRNQEAVLHADGTMELHAASDSDIAKRLAWRNRLVVFEGESLSQALAEMNRYSPRRMVVEDPQLARRQIVGVFSTRDTQTFVSGMEATLGVEAVESGHTILLRNTN